MYSDELITDGGASHWQIATSRQMTRRHSMKTINMCLAFLSFLGGLIALAYILFDPIVKHIILQKLVLRNSSDFAKIWEEPPITPHLKVYFFNFTNAEEFFSGAEKPRLVEVGPYIYHQKWIKENVAWHDNGTMSYSTRKIYKFMPELSVGDHSVDVVTTLNVPMLASYHQMRNKDYFTRLGLEILLGRPWINKTVEEFVWGYEETLFEIAPNAPDNDKFGFFANANNSAHLPLYTMFTGEGDPYKLSTISLFNGNPLLEFWKADQCNLVKGSDGATFNPYIHKDDTLWFFNDQLCRSIPLIFKEEVTSASLPGYRFAPRDDVFMSPQTYPENSCFCTDQTLCDMIGDGFFGISACQHDAPIVLSWPHFLYANRSFQDAIEGINPNEERHGFWFDVQPITGTTLSAKARVQINLAIKHTDVFDDVSKISDTVMPIMWFDEGLDELGPELVDVISTAVLAPPTYKNYVFCVFIGILISVTITSVVAMIRACLNKRKSSKDRETLQKVRTIIKHHQPHLIVGDSDPTVQQPILNSSEATSGISSTVQSSRASSANHSRNTSTGSSDIKESSSDTLGQSRLSPSGLVHAVIGDGSGARKIQIVDPEQLEKLLTNGETERSKV